MITWNNNSMLLQLPAFCRALAFLALFLALAVFGGGRAYAETRTVTNIDTFYDDLDYLIQSGDPTNTLFLQLGGGEMALTNYPGYIILNNNAAVTIRSLDGPQTLTPDGANRHLSISEANLGTATYTLELEFVDVVLDGKGQAGGIQGFAKEVILRDAVIRNCYAAGDSGGVYHTTAVIGSYLEISGGEYSGNSAGGAGGGVLTDRSLRITGGAVIANNTAGGNGGGVYAWLDLTITGGAIIANNTAGGNGGGVWVNSSSLASAVIGSGVTFAGNLASVGYEIDPLNPNAGLFLGITPSFPFTNDIVNNYDVVFYGASIDSVYSVAFMQNDGSGGVFANVKASANNMPLGGDFPAGTPSRSGYTFIEWNDAADGSGSAFDDATPLPGNSIRVYARWERNSSPMPTPNPTPSITGGSGDRERDRSGDETVYLIRFEPNGGNTMARRSVVEGKKLDRPADPVREGFIFTGWFTDKKLTTLYNFNRAVKENFTLYAGWEAEGEPEPERTPVQSSEPEVSPEPAPKRWQTPFSDVKEGDWFYEDVGYVYENGLMTGLTDTEFYPGMAVTRGMIVTILHRMDGGSNYQRTQSFSDLKQDWYRNAVAWASDNGIAAGYGGNLFGPEDSVTREQLAVILYNYARYVGVDTGVNGSLQGYADSGEVSGYAQEAMLWITSQGLIKGDNEGYLSPQGASTRAEAAAIIHRLKEN